MSVEEVFSTIYEKNVWGGEPDTFHSGSGTIDSNNASYIEIVEKLVLANNIQSIVEVGCGDFSIMRRLLTQLPNVKYTGLDIVPSLIEHNQKSYGNENIAFRKANAITDELPQADLIIIRQVLQHLDNAQIQTILKKASTYKFELITEHVPTAPDTVPNLDKFAGPHIRTRIKSGVFIDQPPFSIANASVIYEYRADETSEDGLIPAVIRTYLIKN